MRLSNEQQQILAHIAAQSGKLVRRKGAFVTEDGLITLSLSDVRTLEAKGYLVRAGRPKDAIFDDWHLTDKARALAPAEPVAETAAPSDRAEEVIELIAAFRGAASERGRDKAAAALFEAIVGRKPNRQEVTRLKRP